MHIKARPGFVFRGWFTAADGGNKITKDTDLEDVTKLYAQWEPAPVPDDSSAADDTPSQDGSPSKDAAPSQDVAPSKDAAPAPASSGTVKASVNTRTVSAAKVRRAVKAAGGNVHTLVLGKKVKKISKGAFAGTDIKTLIVTSKKGSASLAS